MKRRRIYSSLNKDRLRSAADRSRTGHLSKLMDDQEREEQAYYHESMNSYNKSRIYKFAPDIENYINNFVDELNSDIKAAIEEYDLHDVGIWGYIPQYFKWLNESYKRGDGLRYGVFYDGFFDGVTARLANYGDVFTISICEGTNSGDPDDFYFAIEAMQANKILECAYNIYRKPFEENAFYNFVIEILDLLLNLISDAVNDAVEDCIMDNPPPLE